jgi:hypothetical protein
MQFDDRLRRAESLASPQRIGPTDEERELARELRSNPRTRKFIAYVVDPANPTPEELSELTPGDRKLLRRYFENPHY